MMMGGYGFSDDGDDSPIKQAKMFCTMSKLSPRVVPKVMPNQITYHRSNIGKGAFSQVHRVLISGPDFDGDMRYALKTLNVKSMSSRDSYEVAAFDLALEAELLSRLDHPNIIKLIAISSETTTLQDGTGFFIVVDLLNDTLIRRMRIWQRTINNKNDGMDVFGRSRHAALRSRIDPIAIGVSKGMEYLHQNNIVLRDLKPGNIGFDSDGNVKIFDLGLARELHTWNKEEVAGSYLYMAPECMPHHDSHWKVGIASDVYSFGVVLWEMCMLAKPYGQVSTRSDLIDLVARSKWRPPVRPIPSMTIRCLIAKCWEDNPSKRPNFSKIVEILEKTSQSTVDGGETALKNSVKRTFSGGLRGLKRWGSAMSTGSEPDLNLGELGKQ